MNSNNNEKEHIIRDILINFDKYFADGLMIKNTKYGMNQNRQVEKITRSGKKVITVNEAVEMIEQNLSVIEKELELQLNK